MPTPRPADQHDELPTLDPADLTRVTGGTGDDMSSAMMMAMAMRNRNHATAAPAPAPAAVPPWQPTITVDGVPQPLSNTGNGTYSTSTPA
jgi:hypothetical protein